MMQALDCRIANIALGLNERTKTMLTLINPKITRRQLITYLEDYCHFRDYRILPKKYYGEINRIGVHYKLDFQDFEQDVMDALYVFTRDGYPTAYFYI